MIALITTVLVADVLVFTPEPVDRHQVAARYRAGCGGAAATGPSCKRLQWQLEDLLYRDLLAGAEATHDTWRMAAAADVPRLAVLGLARLADGYTPADEELVLAQVDSPFPSVRQAAWRVVEQRALERGLRLRPRRLDGAVAPYPIADEAPDAGRLGGPVYPRARFRPFASDEHRATFTTDDAPDQVVAFYAAAGKKALGAAELKAEQKRRADEAMAAQRDPMGMARRMQEAMKAGKDPQQVAMELASRMAGAQKDWTKGVASSEGVVAPRFVPLDDSLLHVVLVFRDDVLGATAVVFPELASAEELVEQRLLGSGKPEDLERLQRRSRALMILSRPVADPP